MGRVDLHVHSTASDGEHAPEDVARRAAASGLTTFALTDPDTPDGVTAARAAAPDGLTVIAGCEFSASAPWGELHLLAYFLPVDSDPLQAFLVSQRGRRGERMQQIVDRLAGLGVALGLDDVQREAGGGALGRPHAARALVRRGAVGTAQEAFDRFLGRGRGAFVPKVLPEVLDVTALVAGLGGVTSAAHLGGLGTDAHVRWLHAAGVTALEVVHPSHDDDTRRRLRQLADRLGMPVTGGSDWHGASQELGPRRAPLGGLDVPMAWLERLERARPAGTEDLTA